MRIGLPLLESLTPSDRAEALLGAREDQWFERKSRRIAADVLARAIVGFANAEGGLIAVGVADGRIEGMADRTGEINARQVNELRRTPRTHCAPPPKVRFRELEVAATDGTVTVLIVEVEPGETLHETSAGDCFLRVGDSTMKLTASQREELAYDRGGSQYEARPLPGATREDLDPERMAELRQAIVTRNDDEKVLAARSLLGPRGEVTIAAYLLLATHPERLMPHAHVRVLRYLSRTPGTGARQTLADDGDVRIEGPIPTVIAKAVEQIGSWIPTRRALLPDGRFGAAPIVPRDAWLEGVVNAVVHRSYSMAGDHIRVAVHPDRVEIESPGRFPGVVDPDQPLEITRYARNPRIARVCNDLGLTQEKGEGIRRIVEEMRLAGLVDPVYRQTSGSVRLALHGTARLAPEVERSLPVGADRVLQVMRSVGQPMGTGEIAAAIGLRRPATIRALRALQQAGELTWHGRSATDPRAAWTLTGG